MWFLLFVLSLGLTAFYVAKSLVVKAGQAIAYKTQTMKANAPAFKARVQDSVLNAQATASAVVANKQRPEITPVLTAAPAENQPQA